MFKKNNSIGMTLIELMFALVLSILMIGSLFEMYLIAENNKIAQETVISMQENAQIISEILKQRMRGLSYTGCAKLTSDFPFTNHLSFPLSQKNRIEPYHSSDVKKGTDAIQLWYLSEKSAILIEKMRDYSHLSLSASLSISPNDYLIISDCKTAETFQVKEIFPLDHGRQEIVLAEPLNKLYEINAEINSLQIEDYFIGQTERYDEYHRPIDALYSKDSQGHKLELVEGVSQMKIFFSTAEENHLIEYPLEKITSANEIESISFSFDLTSVSRFDLHKKWNVYVALS